MSTMNVLDAGGATVAIEKPLTPGRTAAATSRPVALSNEDLAAVNALATALATANTALAAIQTGTATIATNAASTAPSPVILSLPYQAVAVSQTAKLLGATGAIGDTLQGIIIQPTGTTVGSVIVYDNVTAVYTYPGGTVTADLRPIIVGMGMVCAGAGWHVTTPSNATVLALGKFT